MFDLKKTYGYDKKKAEEGVKYIIGSDPEKDYVLIRRVPNDSYTATLQKTFQANAKVLEYMKTQDPEASVALDRKLQSEVLAETVIIGWGENFGEDGKKILYSKDECARILVTYPDFRRDCVEFASNPQNYPLTPDVEEIKKK